MGKSCITLNGEIIGEYKEEGFSDSTPRNIEFTEGAFRNNKNLTEVTLFAEDVEIPVSAFENCEYLKHIRLENRVKNIGKYAFCGCKNIENVYIPGTVTIGVCAFSECTSLKKVEFEIMVKVIPKSCFSNCCKLEEIIFKDTQNSYLIIESLALNGCDELRSIRAKESKKEIDLSEIDIVKDNFEIAYKEGQSLILCKPQI